MSSTSESIKLTVFDQFDQIITQIQSQTSDLRTKRLLEHKSVEHLKNCMLFLHYQFLRANSELLHGHLDALESHFSCRMPSNEFAAYSFNPLQPIESNQFRKKCCEKTKQHKMPNDFYSKTSQPGTILLLLK